MDELTHKQQKVLDFIKNTLVDRGYPPSLREICAHLGISGPSNALKHMKALEKKGFIKRRRGRSRAVEIAGHPERPPVVHATEAASERTVPLPVLGRVRAGVPQLAVEDIEGYLRLDASFFDVRGKGAFVLRAEGESMVEAGISDGDLLVVRPQRVASSGDIVVAMMGDEATVKRLFLRGDAVELRPENPAMEPIVVGEGSGFAIVGRVVYVIKRI